jgi:2-keto-4-pentenoate hydratase
MTPEAISACAETLLQAEETRRQCGLISLAHPGAVLDDAYAIQSALVASEAGGGAAGDGLEDRADIARHAKRVGDRHARQRRSAG